MTKIEIRQKEIIEEIISSDLNKLEYLIQCIYDDDRLFVDDDDNCTIRDSIIDLLNNYYDEIDEYVNR